MHMRMHNPPHPGEVLRDYLGTISVTDAAEHLGVTRASLSRILNGSAGISAEMALRLSEAMGTTPELVDRNAGPVRTLASLPPKP